MPGTHKNPTISFRPSEWERAIIEQRVAVSGMYKKDFIAQSCIYSKIIIEDSRDVIQRILDAIHNLQIDIREIAGQMQSGDFILSNKSYQELKLDYLAFMVTIVDILDGAAYLFEAEQPVGRRNWKAELELEQLRDALERGQNGRDMEKRK